MFFDFKGFFLDISAGTKPAVFLIYKIILFGQDAFWYFIDLLSLEDKKGLYASAFRPIAFLSETMRNVAAFAH